MTLVLRQPDEELCTLVSYFGDPTDYPSPELKRKLLERYPEGIILEGYKLEDGEFHDEPYPLLH